MIILYIEKYKNKLKTDISKYFKKITIPRNFPTASPRL